MSGHRGRHPLLLASACRLYGLMIWCYPPTLRREYRREMLLTFKNAAQDALDAGSVSSVLLFAMHTVTDWLRTLMLEQEEPMTLSLLGLGASESAGAGCIDSSNVSVSLMLATLGVVLLIAGWYEWLSMISTIMSHHHVV